MKSAAKLAFSCLVFVGTLPFVAYADIVSVSSGPGNVGGNLTVITAPSAVGSNFNVIEGLPSVVAFNESQNVTLSSALTTDIGGPIAAGTVVDSQFFSANSDAGGNGPFSITFSGKVLGVVYLDGSANYAATDFLGAAGTTYSESVNCPLCGFEPGDTASFSGDTVTFDDSYSNPGDMARVITLASTTPAPVPEPASLTLVLSALGLVVPVYRRRVGRFGAAK